MKFKKLLTICLFILLLPLYVHAGGGYKLYDGTEKLSSEDVSQINTTSTDLALTMLNYGLNYKKFKLKGGWS